ncbi:MAG: YraN family protein [Chloroflexota bacterium]
MTTAAPGPPPAHRGRRAAGDRAESFVAERLGAAGWAILARQVPVGRDELDLVAVEPAPDGNPGTLVFVEVRSARSERFGGPEESVVGRKAARTYRAAFALLRAGALPDGRPLPALPWRVDLVSVVGDPRSSRHTPVVRHLRGVDPG